MSYCDWDMGNSLMTRYHDEEWGVPVHGDQRQFEHLMMEAMQCGLNWAMMLGKREVFRACFDGFDPEKVARYGEDDVRRIMETPDMIRSPRKIAAVINNAQRFLEMEDELGSFSEYLWGFAGGVTIRYNRHAEGWIPASNGLSSALSRELRSRGFRYLGPITVYSHLQACGIIDDHDENCPRHTFLADRYPQVERRRTKEQNVVYYGTK